MTEPIIIKRIKDWTVKDTKTNKYIHADGDGELQEESEPTVLYGRKDNAEAFISSYQEDKEAMKTYKDIYGIHIESFKVIPLLVCILDEEVE